MLIKKPVVTLLAVLWVWQEMAGRLPGCGKFHVCVSFAIASVSCSYIPCITSAYVFVINISSMQKVVK